MDWLKVLKPQVMQRLGAVRYVLFDFDGTLSVLRQGWEEVMATLMVESICAGQGPMPEIELEIQEYIDRSTGMLTIRQMEWMAQTVRRYGFNPEPKTALEYKRIYRQRILQRIQDRLNALENGELPAQAMMIQGAPVFLEQLAERGVMVYLVSGTDHEDVLNEARLLGLPRFFDNRISGALDANEAHDKERVIRRILNENSLHGDELIVIGDGPLEIRLAASSGAIALGIASDEIARQGWNQRKVRRLVEAGADGLIADFTRSELLVKFLFGELDWTAEGLGNVSNPVA
jgi:phosphoglycolate phosphatase-like HAD superfamily hydrolase